MVINILLSTSTNNYNCSSKSDFASYSHNRLLWFSRNIFFLHNMEQRKRNDFFLQHLQVFFLNAKLISTPLLFFLHKKRVYYVCYFFKKRETGFVPKNKSVSRGRAEIIGNTSDTQFSCLPQNYSFDIEESIL